MTRRFCQGGRSRRTLWALALGSGLSLFPGSATAGEIYGQITENGQVVRAGIVVAVVGSQKTNETRTEAYGSYRLVFDYPSGRPRLKDKPALWIRSDSGPPSIRIAPELRDARIHANWMIVAGTAGTSLSAEEPIVAVISTKSTTRRYRCKLEREGELWVLKRKEQIRSSPQAGA